MIPEFVVETECPHGNYYMKSPGILACRCVVCFRCREHTGNSHQGHWWRLCRVTGGIREFHFCCPSDCELGSDITTNS